MRRRQMMAEVTARLMELHTTIDAGAARDPDRGLPSALSGGWHLL